MALDVNLNKELLTSLNKLIKGLEKLDQTIKDTNKVAERLETAFSPTVFNDFLKALDKLDDQGKDAFRTLTRGMADVIQEVGKLDVVAARAIPALNRLIKTLTGDVKGNLPGKQTLQNLANLIKQFVTDINEVGAINVASLKSIRAVADTVVAFSRLTENQDLAVTNLTRFREFIEGIDVIFKKINDLPPFDTSAIQKARTLRDFLTAFVQIERSDFGVSQRLIQNIDGVFKIFTILEKIDSVNINEQSLEKLSGLTRILRTIAASIEIFAKDIGKVNVGAITGKLAAITTITTLIGSISQKLPGTQSLIEISKVFQRIGIAFSNLSRAFQNTEDNPGLNRSVLIKIAASMGALALVLKAIGVVGRFKNDDSASVFANIISRIASALVNLRKLNVDKDNNVNSKAIIQGVKQFVQIIRSLRSLRGAEIPDLDKPLKAVAEFINAFGNLDTGDQRGKSAAFKSFINDLEDAFKKLSRFGAVALPNLTPLTQGFREFNEQASLEGVTVGVNNLRDAKPVFADFLNIVEVLKLAVQGVRFLNVERGLRDVARAAIEVGNNIRQAGNDLREFGQNIIQNFGLQNLFQSGAFTSAVDFDKLSTQLKVFGNLTDEELRSAQDFANQIGIDYPLSANEALEATLDLNKAGLSLAETFTTLPAAADLAALSESGSLETATQTIIGATKAFKEFADGVPASFENAGVAATLFSGAADASTASTESLNEGMANIGATAATFGLNLADTLSILAALDDAQIKGAEGGTALRSVLTQLNSAAGQKELQRLGVSLTDAEGNFRDLDAVFKDLNTALNGTVTVTTTVTNLTADQTRTLNLAQTAYAGAQGKILLYNDQLQVGVIDQDTYNKKVEEQQEILSRTSGVITEVTGSITETNRITSELTRSQQDNAESAKLLFGAYGLAAGSILIANNGFDDYRQKVLAAEEANIRAQKLLDNLAGDFEQLRGSVETLITKAFLPLINRALRPIIKLGRAFVDFFLSLPQPILDIATNTVLLVSAFATFVGIGSVVVGVILSFGGAILTAVGAVGALILNGPLLIAAVTGFIASFAGLIIVVTAVSAIFIGFSTLITNVFQAIETNAGGAGSAFGRLRGSISGLFNVIRKTFGKFGDAISLVFGDRDPDAFGRVLAGVFDTITNKVRALTGVFGKFNRTFDFEQFRGNLYFVRLGIDNIAKSIQSLFKGEGFGELDASVGTIAAGLTKVFSQITGIDLGDLFSTFLTKGFGEGLQQAASGILNVFSNFFLENEDGIKNAILSIFNFILPGSGLARLLDILGLNDLANAIRTVLEPIQNIFKNVLGTFFDVLKGQNLEEAILGNFGSAGKSIVNVAKAIGKAFSSFASIIETLVAALFPPGTTISGGSIIEVVFKGIETAFLALDAFVLSPLSKILPDLINTISSGFNLILGVGEEVFRFLAKLTEPIRNLFSELFSGGIDLQTFFEKIPTALSTIFQSLISQIPAALSDIGSFITDAFTNIGELIGSPFLIQLGEQLRNGDFGGALTTIANEFVGLIGRAIQLIPTLLSAGLTVLGAGVNSPILELLGEQVGGGNFAGVIQTLSQAFFDLFVSALQGVGNLISTGLNTVVTDLGDKVLARITELINGGDFVSAIGFLAGSFVGLIGQAIAKIPELISSLLGDVQLPEGVTGLDITSLTQSFVDLISDAILGVGDLLGGALEGFGITIGSKVLETLGLQLQAGDFGAAAQTVIDAFGAIVLNLVNSALDLIQLGLPIVEKIRNDLANADDLLDVTQAIADSLGELFGDAVALVPKILINLGDIFGVDLRSVIAADTIERIATAIGNLISFPIELLTNVFDGIKSFLDFLGNFKIVALLGVVVALRQFALIQGPALAARFGFAQLYTVLQALSGLTLTGAIGAIKALGSAALSAAKPLLGIAAVLVVLNSVFKNLETLFSGDVIGFIRDTFLDIGATVLGFLGLETDIEAINTTLKQLFAVVILNFERFVRDLGNRFKIAVQNIQDAAQNAADDIRARTETLGGAFSRFGEVYFALGTRLGNEGGTKLFNGLGFELTKAAEQNEPEIRELILRQLRVNFTKIVEEFGSIIPQLATVDDETFRNIANTIIGAGALEDAFRLVAEQQGPAGLNAFVQRLIADAPTALAGANVDDLGFILIDSITSGLITDENAVGLLDALVTAGTITPEKREQLKKDIEAAIARELEIINTGLGADTPPVEVPVNVTPTVEGTDGETPTWVDNLATEVQGLTTGDGNEIPVTVTPTVADDAGTTIEAELAEQTPPEIPTNIDVGDPQSIEDGTQALLDLQNQTVLTEGALTTFQEKTSAVTLAINESSLAIQAYGVIAGLSIGGVSLAWLGYNGVVNLVSKNITENLVNVQGEIFKFVDATVIKFQSLLDMVVSIANTLLSLPDALTVTLSTSGGRDDGGPMALGGATSPKKFYQVFDSDSPELLEEGGKFYLLPAKSGRVTPMQAVPQLATAGAGGMGSMNVQINAPITIDVSNLPAGLNAADVAQIVGQRVDSAFRETQNTLIRRLRRAGAQGIDG